MVFGLFSRKSTLDGPDNTQARLPTPTPSLTHPSPLRFSTVPSGTLACTTTVSDQTTDTHLDETKVLYDLMLRVPPKTLHAYTLAHLRPRQAPLPSTNTLGLPHPETTTPRPPSPATVAKLTTFFSTLAPPPLSHCMRCHKDFYDVENEDKDKACRVPHDDESAVVLRVSGVGGGHETFWGCCAQTVSGDGSEGPPDGWCYEGRHTTDLKRARYRSDDYDKLISCLKLNCHGIRDRLPLVQASPSLRNAVAGTSSSARRSNPSPTRSLASTATASRTTRKRPRKSLKEASGSEAEDDASSSVGRSAKAKDGGKSKRSAEDVDGDGESMAVDAPPKSQVKPKPKPLARSASRACPPTSTSSVASLPNHGGSIASVKTMSPAVVLVAKKRSMAGMAPPKSTSRTLVSQSQTHAAAATSDSEASTQSRPRTRSCVREESRGRVNANTRSTKTSKLVDESGRMRRGRKAAKLSASSEEERGDEEEEEESDEEERGRERKRKRVRRG